MKKLGKFEIIEKVGQGAMGVVYKARDPFIDRIVALKTLTTGLADDANLLRRFYSEARSAGGLQHPNIVTIYELGHEGDTPFIAMQFLTGESLDKILDRRPNLPLSQKIGFIIYVCRALEYAHKQSPPVVHRDIKPGNVMVTTEGAVVVVDFGIARLGEGTRSQSAGMLIGTLGYMSPQLFRNGAADARSDIWATGVMFYELLAYCRPFEGDNAAALMSNIILEKPRSLADAAHGTPADVQAVVERMLAKDAEARYQSMEEVLLELEPIWRRVQQAEVSDLLTNGQQLFESGDLENAKAKVSQIIQIDTSNTQAKSLLEKINAEVRRKQVVPQLKARVESAGRLLANGQVEDAKAEVEAALKLDSTYQPARELLGQAQAALERARNIAQALRASKQRMAEGALTEAELQLDKVLEIDPGNAAAREQLKQIREERSRRERRKIRDEALHRARTFWTNLQYEECISLLLSAQKQFPGDSEITKLLESAQQDQAEQQRQTLVTEARNLLSKQRFDDSLRALDLLLERYPSDATAKNLRTHAVQGRDQQRRDQRLAEGKATLRAWVKEGKYAEAITQAGQLSKEFPDDFELKELLDFAHTELSLFEQKRRFEQSSKHIQQTLKDGRFSEAIQAAEKALLEFPKNLDLLILLDRGKKEQSEKEKHERLKRSLREIERMVDRQALTDAIDLARRTLRDVDEDPLVADTLLRLEREFEFREEKKRKQNETVVKARTMLNAGKLTDATSIVQDAIETQLLSASDPRVKQLMDEIAARKEPPPSSAAAAAASGPTPSATTFGLPVSATPSPDSGKDYIYQRGTPLPDESLSPERDAVASAFSPIVSSGSSTQPIPPPAPPFPSPSTGTKERQKRRTESSPASGNASATQMISPAATPEQASSQLFAPEIEVEEQLAVDKRPLRPPTPQRRVKPTSKPIPRRFWKNPLAVGGVGLTVAMGIIATVYVLRPSQGNKQKNQPAAGQLPQNPMTETPPSHATSADNPVDYREPPSKTSTHDSYTQAEEYYGRGDWSRAKSAFQRIAQAADADANIRNKATQRINDAQNHIDELNWLKDANSALNRQDRTAAKTLYQKVANLNLEHATDAKKMVQQIDTGNLEDFYRAQINAALQNRDYLGARQKLNQLTWQGGHDPNGEIARQIEASESQWFSALQNQFDQAKAAASNVEQLQGLQAELSKIASSGGANAARARAIAESAIPSAIAEINKKKQQEAAWLQTVAEYKTVIGAGSRTTLISFKDQLQPFLSGRHASEAQQYIARINEALSSQPPAAGSPQPATVLPTTVPKVNPGESPKPEIPQAAQLLPEDRNAILDVISRYADAYNRRDPRQISSVWPTISKERLNTIKDFFRQQKSIQMSDTIQRITPVDENHVLVYCSQAVHILEDGKPKSTNALVTIYLVKKDKGWQIAEIPIS
jgi:serine/threonine protein kinase